VQTRCKRKGLPDPTLPVINFWRSQKELLQRQKVGQTISAILARAKGNTMCGARREMN
jgi:hypothetical protein